MSPMSTTPNDMRGLRQSILLPRAYRMLQLTGSLTSTYGYHTAALARH